MDLSDLEWSDACDQALADYLDLVAYLVDTYEHLPPERYLEAVALDRTYADAAAELDARVDDLGCSEIRGVILATVSLDGVAHSSVFGQFIKVFHDHPFGDGWTDETYRYVPAVTGSAPPEALPVVPQWTDPESCEEAWDRYIEILDLAVMVYALGPEVGESEELQTVMADRFGMFETAHDELGCDHVARLRYQLEVAASRSADDFWGAVAKTDLVSGLRFYLGEAFVPALYPEAMRPGLGEPARSLLRSGSLDEMTARVATTQIDIPSDYLRIVDLPAEEIGGVLFAIPRTHVAVHLATDDDFEALAAYDAGLAGFAEENRLVPDGFFSDRMVVVVAYSEHNEALDFVWVEVVRHAWSDERLEEFFEEPKRLETPAGEWFWDDIEQSAHQTFAEEALLLITYLLPVPELNVTYGLHCASSLPVRDGFHEECEQIARTLYPVGRIIREPAG